MVQEKVILSVRSRGKPVKKLPEEVTVPSSEPATEIYKELASRSGTSVHRLRITKGSDGALVPNNKDVIVQSTGLRHQSTIYVKDLGPQIPWRTVFLVEYLGPLLIHPLFFTYYQYSPSNKQLTSTLTHNFSLALILLHFIKRELETLFVHRFSSATMPAFNIFKNSAHYWLLSGLNMAFWIYRGQQQAPNPILTYAGLLLFIIGELGNLNTHVTLRNLRPSGSRKRAIPQGLGFSLVTCPNYMFETVAWTGIAMVSWSLSTVVFAFVAVVQMGLWAKKKEVRYRKEFGAKYQRKRYVMLPGIW